MVRHETNLNLSDDENEEVDDENQNKIQHSDSDTENDDERDRTVCLINFLSSNFPLFFLLESKYIIINGFSS